MNLNIHDRLAYYSSAVDDNELINRVLNRPDIFLNPVGDSNLAKDVEGRIQDLLEKNINTLNRSDTPALKRLHRLVHILEVKSGLQNDSNGKPLPGEDSTLEKTISTCIGVILSKPEKAVEVLVQQPETSTLMDDHQSKNSDSTDNLNKFDLTKTYQLLSETCKKYSRIASKTPSFIQNLFRIAAFKMHGKDLSTELLSFTKSNDPDMVKLLNSFGANVNKSDNKNLSPLMWAELCNAPEMMQTLKEIGADWDFAKEANRRKFIAHLWGLGDTTALVDQEGARHVLKLEGCTAKYAMQMLSSYVNDFFNNQYKNHSGSKDSEKTFISKNDQIKIQEAIANAFPLSNTFNRDKIKAGDPFVILAGTVDHAVSMVLCKNQLIVFNRGQGRKANAAEIFSLPPGNINDALIINLAKTYPNMESFNQMISDLNLPSLGGYVQKSQKVGNCAWVSAKGAFGVLCRLYSNDEIGREAYKGLALHTRKIGLETYLKEAQPIDFEILNNIKRKCAKKSKSLAVWVSKKIMARMSPKARKRRARF